jgi:hypothetical protein
LISVAYITANSFYPRASSMSDLFCEPSAEEKSAVGDLTGKRISIFWDGDSVFFSAKIVNFDKAANVHNVKYDNDDTGDLYPETLDKQPWKIWTGTEQEFSAYNLMKVEVENCGIFYSSINFSYFIMV